MAKKNNKNDKKEELKQHRAGIVEYISQWMTIRERGCQDPQWPDGANMNLERNHVLYTKKVIMDLCYELNESLPAEYFWKTPPEVSEKYMAVLRKGSAAASDPVQKERLAKLKKWDYGLTAACPEYNPEPSLL